MVSFKNESDTQTGGGGGKQSDDEDEPDEDDDEYEDISVEENNNDGDDDEDPDDDEADVEEDDEEVDETKQQEKSTEPDSSAPKESQDEFGSALIKAFNEAQNAAAEGAATKKDPAPAAKTKAKSSQGSTTTTTYARSYMKAPYVSSRPTRSRSSPALLSERFLSFFKIKTGMACRLYKLLWPTERLQTTPRPISKPDQAEHSAHSRAFKVKSSRKKHRSSTSRSHISNMCF